MIDVTRCEKIYSPNVENYEYPIKEEAHVCVPIYEKSPKVNNYEYISQPSPANGTCTPVWIHARINLRLFHVITGAFCWKCICSRITGSHSSDNNIMVKNIIIGLQNTCHETTDNIS